MDHAKEPTEDAMKAITDRLAAQCQLRTTGMLAKLLPEGAPEEFVLAVCSGMLAGVFQELWARSEVVDLDNRLEGMGDMAKALALEFGGQFRAADLLAQAPVAGRG